MVYAKILSALDPGNQSRRISRHKNPFKIDVVGRKSARLTRSGGFRSGEYSGKDAFRLWADRIDIGVVVYYIVGTLFLEVKWFLQFLETLEIVLTPAAFPPNAGESNANIGINKHDAIASLGKPRLEQKR